MKNFIFVHLVPPSEDDSPSLILLNTNEIFSMSAATEGGSIIYYIDGNEVAVIESLACISAQLGMDLDSHLKVVGFFEEGDDDMEETIPFNKLN